MRRDRRPPNLACLLPAVPTEGQRALDEGAIRHARKHMHTAVVAVNGGTVLGGEGGDVAVVGRLGVFTEARVVVGCAGVFHVS